MTIEREALIAFMGENWPFFDAFGSQAETSLKKVSRQLPPEFYSGLREGIMGALISARPDSRLRVRVVIDSNIVVMDALRVSRGRPSSTERVLTSPFIEALAPPQIREETERVLQRKLHRGPKLKSALDHADRILSRIRITSEFSQNALRRARKLIGAHASEDMCFLALAIDSGAAAVVSRDRIAFDAQAQVQRWELGEAVQLVVDRESGALSLLIAGTSAEAVGRALAWLFTMMLRALEEIVTAIASLVSAAVKGTAEALAKVPSWVWVVLAAVAIGFLAAYALHGGFREWLNSNVSKGFDFVTAFLNSAATAVSDLFVFLRDLVVMVWNLMIPVTAAALVACGVLARRISLLLDSIKDEIASSAT